MIWQPTNSVGLALNIAGWALAHAGTGYVVHRMDRRRFQADTWLTRIRPWERSERLYHWLGVPRWKDRLPEAGAIFTGGVSKRHLPGTDAASLELFAAETRRAEWGHWTCMWCAPAFVLWNPPLIAALLLVYGVLVNLPFIVIQRWNRLRLLRVLAKRTRK